MKQFNRRWLDGDIPVVASPTSQSCSWCGENICEYDMGVIMPLVRVDGTFEIAIHAECHIRQVVGSVAHQRGECSCYGGVGEDSPELSRRAAARAAVHYATRKEAARKRS